MRTSISRIIFAMTAAILLVVGGALPGNANPGRGVSPATPPIPTATPVETASAAAETLAQNTITKGRDSFNVNQLLSGSFTWTAEFSVSLYSRVWLQDGETLRISSFMNCTGDPGLDEYYITPYGPTGSEDTVEYPCNITAHYTWNVDYPGAYYQFRLQKRNNGNYIVGNGLTEYL